MVESMKWLHALAGRFLVFDGPDGSGKSTQIAKFVALCRKVGLDVLEVREPGGTAIGEQIRAVLLSKENEEMALRCELMLYMASRAQLIEEKIRPARTAGMLVLADRFISSTLAYQGAAGGIPLQEIMACGQVAIGGDWPDLTVIFDVDESTAATRLNPILDRMELKGAPFHRKVREGFLDQAHRDPGHYLVIDAAADPERVFGELIDSLRERFEHSRGAD
jgi:dTMP kinase